MNENIDLTKILKDCPEDTKFYCSICGEVTIKIKTNYTHPIHIYQKAIYAENPILICRLSIFGKYNKEDFLIEFENGNFKNGERIVKSYKQFISSIVDNTEKIEKQKEE